MLGSVAVQERLVQLNLQRVRHDVLRDFFAARLEDVVYRGGHGLGRLLNGGLLDGEHLLAHHILHRRIDKPVVEDLHPIVPAGAEGLHHLGRRIRRALEVQVVEDGVRLIAQVERGEVLGPAEHIGRLLAEAEDAHLFALQLLQALVGELDDVVVERSAQAAVGGHGHEQDPLGLPLDGIGVLGRIQGRAHIDQDLLQLLGVRTHLGHGVLRATKLRRGHQLHRLRDLPSAPDRGNPVAYFLETGHGSDQLANCLLTSSAAAFIVACASSVYLPDLSSAMVSACLVRR